jgi:hypothetical protein
MILLETLKNLIHSNLKHLKAKLFKNLASGRMICKEFLIFIVKKNLIFFTYKIKQY